MSISSQTTPTPFHHNLDEAAQNKVISKNKLKQTQGKIERIIKFIALFPGVKETANYELLIKNFGQFKLDIKHGEPEKLLQDLKKCINDIKSITKSIKKINQYPVQPGEKTHDPQFSLKCIGKLLVKVQKSHQIIQRELLKIQTKQQKTSAKTQSQASKMPKPPEQVQKQPIPRLDLQFYKKALASARWNEKEKIAIELLSVAVNLPENEKDTAEACKMALPLIHVTPTVSKLLSSAHLILGRFEMASNHTQKAIEQFRESSKLDPTNHTALQELGHALESTKLYEEALDAYKLSYSLQANVELHDKILSLETFIGNTYFNATFCSPSEIQNDAKQLVAFGTSPDVVRALGVVFGKKSTENIELQGLFADTQYMFDRRGTVLDRSQRACALIETAYDGAFAHQSPSAMPKHIRTLIDGLKKKIENQQRYIKHVQRAVKTLASASQHRYDPSSDPVVVLKEASRLMSLCGNNPEVAKESKALKQLLSPEAPMHIAASHFKNILKHPDLSMEQSITIIQAFLRTRQFRQAVEFYEQMVQIYPNLRIDHHAYTELALSNVDLEGVNKLRLYDGLMKGVRDFIQNHQYADAIRACKQGIILAPDANRRDDCLRKLTSIAHGLFNQNSFSLALEAYEILISNEASLANDQELMGSIYLNAGKACMNKKADHKAYRYLFQASMIKDTPEIKRLKQECSYAVDQDKRQHYDGALQAYNSRNYPEMLKEFRMTFDNALTDGTKIASDLISMTENFQLTNPNEAVEAYELALKYVSEKDIGEKKLSAVHFFLAETYKSSGDYDKTIEHLKLALECAPDNIKMLKSLANAYVANGQNDLAKTVYANLGSIGDLNSFVTLGDMLFKEGNIEKALNCYEKLGDRYNEKITDCLLLLANRHQGINNTQAFVYFQEALDVSKKSEKVVIAMMHFGLALAEGAGGPMPLAYQCWKILTPIVQHSNISQKDLLARLGIALAQAELTSNKTRSALDYYTVAFQLDPTNAQLAATIGDLYVGLEQDGPQLVHQYYQAAHKLQPQNKDYLRKYISSELQMAKHFHFKALEPYALVPDQAKTTSDTIKMCHDKAILHYRKAHELDPSSLNSGDCNALIESYCANHHFPAAVAFYEQMKTSAQGLKIHYQAYLEIARTAIHHPEYLEQFDKPTLHHSLMHHVHLCEASNNFDATLQYINLAIRVAPKEELQTCLQELSNLSHFLFQNISSAHQCTPLHALRAFEILIHHIDKFEGTPKRNSEIFGIAAQLAAETGSHAQAIAYFHNALKGNNNAGLRFGLAKVLYANGDIEGALNNYKIAVQLDPTQETYKLALVSILTEIGDQFNIRAAIGQLNGSLRHLIETMKSPALVTGIRAALKTSMFQTNPLAEFEMMGESTEIDVLIRQSKRAIELLNKAYQDHETMPKDLFNSFEDLKLSLDVLENCSHIVPYNDSLFKAGTSTGFLHRAAYFYNEAIDLAPNVYGPHINSLLDIYHRAKMHSKAIALFRSSTERFPTKPIVINSEIYSSRINELIDIKLPEEAVSLAEEAVSRFPQAQRLKASLNTAYNVNADQYFEKSEQHAKNAYQREDHKYYAEAKELYEKQMQNLKKATQLYEKSLADDTQNNPHAHAQLAKCYNILIEKNRNFESNLPLTFTQKETLHHNIHIALQNAAKLDINNAVYQFEYGKYEYQHGSTEIALAYFQKAAELDPHNVKYFYGIMMAAPDEDEKQKFEAKERFKELGGIVGSEEYW